MVSASALGDPSGPPWARGSDVAGEPPAFSAAVREHDALLRGLARKLCGNDADADDLVHDAYERALRAWGRYVDRGNLRSWLAAILHNVFIDRCRKVKRTPHNERIEHVDIPAAEPSPPPRWTEVSADAVTEALATLGPDFRRVYEMHAAGRSYDEISTELGIARATVGTRLIRARRRLKETLLRNLGDQGGEE